MIYKTFFTSDWHIGHEKVIQLDGRPFRDLDHMHKVLLNNYNSSVSSDDVCYFLGDMGMGKSQALKDLIPKLNGTKILVLGNHDAGKNVMKNMGFDLVLNGAVLWVANSRVTLSHCPLMGVWREDIEGMKGAIAGEMWHGESRHCQKYSMLDEGQFHLHGHIHSPNHGKSTKILGRQFDVGVAANKYRPVSISDIESWITIYKRENI